MRLIEIEDIKTALRLNKDRYPEMTINTKDHNILSTIPDKCQCLYLLVHKRLHLIRISVISETTSVSEDVINIRRHVYNVRILEIRFRYNCDLHGIEYLSFSVM